MAESLVIKKFGAIEKAKLDNIGQLLILIGESGSGKSTILKVLSMCRWIYKQQNIRAYLRESGVNKVPFGHNINDYLKSSGLQDYVREGTLIQFDRDGVSITIRAKVPFQRPNSATMEVTEPTKEDLCLEKVCYMTEKRNLLADLLTGNFEKAINDYYLNDLHSEVREAWKKVRDLRIAAVDVDLHTKKVGNSDALMIEGVGVNGDAYSIHFEDSSSGIQSTVPLEMLMTYYAKYFNLEQSLNTGVINFLGRMDALKYFRPNQNIGEIDRKCIDVHIEEPEMCLYPTNQIKWFNHLLEQTMVDEHPYMIRTAITTHSPYLLNYLNLLFKANDMQQPFHGVSLDYDIVTVYAVDGGRVRDLKVRNAHLVDPAYLSAPIDDIYNEYEALG